MELFGTINDGWKSLKIFGKISMLDVAEVMNAPLISLVNSFYREFWLASFIVLMTKLRLYGSLLQ